MATEHKFIDFILHSPCITYHYILNYQADFCPPLLHLIILILPCDKHITILASYRPNKAN